MLLPGLLATEAGGQKEFDIETATVGEALRALPVRDLVLNESGEVRSLVHVYVDGQRAGARPRGGGRRRRRIRIVAAIAGGEPPA